MAHIGRDYKLAFRRDYGINTFTVNGPAESYRVTTGQWDVQGQANPQTFFFRGRNHHKESGEGRIWNFDVLNQAGINWAGNVEITNDPNEGITKAELLIADDFNLIGFIGEYTAIEGNPYIWSGFGFQLSKILFQTNLIQPNRFVHQLIFDAWFWVDGP